jgi:Fe2+ transport system protein FeoA
VGARLACRPVKPQEKKQDILVVEGHCSHPPTCPLSHVPEGCTVCIKELTASPDISNRLREMGFGEEKHIRLVSQAASIICQVCNARLGISRQLAEQIMVQPLTATHKKRP